MTLHELRRRVSPPGENTELPTAKYLKQNQIPVISRSTNDSTVIVYDNGFVVYVRDKRHTVFPLPCEGTGYKYNTCDESRNVDADCFDGCDFAVLLTLIGEDRIIDNTDRENERRTPMTLEQYDNMLSYMQNDRRDCEDEVSGHMSANEMLCGLTERQRSVVLMHAIYDLTFADIAERIGMSRQNAHRLYKKGVKNLETFA